MLAALGAAQLAPDPSMFSALAQLSSLSSTMSNSGMDTGDHHHLSHLNPHHHHTGGLDTTSRFKANSSASSTPKSGKPPLGKPTAAGATPSTSSSQSHKSAASGSAKKSRVDDSFYQGLDLSLKHSRASMHKSKADSRSKSPLDSDD